MYEAYRVLREFQWRGYVYAPQGKCWCECNKDDASRILNHCTGAVGTSCNCPDAAYCGCRIRPEQNGGDIWIVEAGNTRKPYILNRRFAIYDASLPSVDELLANPAFARLIEDPRLAGVR